MEEIPASSILIVTKSSLPPQSTSLYVKELCDKFISERPFVIVRYHAVQTEVEIVTVPVEHKRGKPENARPDIRQSDDLQILDETIASRVIKTRYGAAAHRPFNVVESLVKQLDRALSLSILKFRGGNLAESPNVNVFALLIHGLGTGIEHTEGSGDLRPNDYLAFDC